MSRAHRLAGQPCPACRKHLDAASNAETGETHAPKVGDLTVCAYCGTTLEFGIGLVLRVTQERDARGVIDMVQRVVRGRPS